VPSESVFVLRTRAQSAAQRHGNKVSIATPAKSNIIVGVISHAQHMHDSKTLPAILAHCQSTRGKAVKAGVCDRGYRGPKTVGETQIILPAPPLKRDNRYQQDKKRRRCRRRAALEPIIGHLKADFRLARNCLTGVIGDHINVLMAAVAWNFSLWMRLFFVLLTGVIEPPVSIHRLSRVLQRLIDHKNSTVSPCIV
jgi:IS5 family transposase